MQVLALELEQTPVATRAVVFMVPRLHYQGLSRLPFLQARRCLGSVCLLSTQLALTRPSFCSILLAKLFKFDRN